MDAVIAACTEAINAQAISKDVILNILSRQTQSVELVEDVAHDYPVLRHIPQSNLNMYDLLLTEACR
jgi:hypothetical protein